MGSEPVDAVIEAIRTRHPYEVPEIVATAIGTGFGAYLDWIAAETQPPPAARS